MGDYIERSKLIESINRDALELVYYSKEEALDVIASEPAADVAPVVHARWVLKHVGAAHYWECSACHENPCIYVTKNTKFCPNCGAKMDAND